MKRDMDLIREILLKLEAVEAFNGDLQPVTATELGITEYGEMEFTYNAALLIEAKMLTGNTRMAVEGHIVIGALTWGGHDFLDAIRDSKIWQETKEGAKQVGGFTLDLLKALAKGLVKKKIEQHTGVELDL